MMGGRHMNLLRVLGALLQGWAGGGFGLVPPWAGDWGFVGGKVSWQAFLGRRLWCICSAKRSSISLRAKGV